MITPPQQDLLISHTPRLHMGGHMLCSLHCKHGSSRQYYTQHHNISKATSKISLHIGNTFSGALCLELTLHTTIKGSVVLNQSLTGYEQTGVVPY